LFLAQSLVERVMGMQHFPIGFSQVLSCSNIFRCQLTYMNAFSSLYVMKKMRIYVDNPYFIDFLEHLQRWCSVCGLAKIFFTSEFSYLLFCNPTHKTETGSQQISNGGTTDSKPHGPIIMMGPIKNTEQ